MKPKNARTLNAWHPPRPGDDGSVAVVVHLRWHEYERLLQIADRYSLTEADTIRVAVLQLLRHAARNPVGFHTSERR